MIIINFKKNKGFSILAVILVIVAIVVGIGIWSISGQTNNGNDNSKIKLEATAIINDSLALKSAFEGYIVKGYAPNNILFLPNTPSSGNTVNILEPINGISVPMPNASSIRIGSVAPDGFWILHRAVRLQTIPTYAPVGTSNPEIAFVLGGVKDEVCKHINNILSGSPYIDNRDVSVGSNILIGGLSGPKPSTSDPNSSYSFPISVNNVTMAGCFGPSSQPDRNLYFMIIQVN